MVSTLPDFNVTCSDKPTVTLSRYPGEACATNDDCVYLKNCTNKVCVGTARNSNCSMDIECVKSNYCNATVETPVGVCLAQVGKGEKCYKSNQCPNSQACQNGTCTDYYSLTANTTLQTDIANSEVLCKYATKDASNRCNEYKYATGMTVNKAANLVSCTFSSQTCNYTSTDLSNFTLPCDCAMNSDASSWCPASPVDNNDKFSTYYSSLKATYVNGCHTLSRFMCYDTPASAFKSVQKNSWDATLRSHWYNAGPCVKSVFGSSNYVIFSSFLALFSVFAYLF